MKVTRWADIRHRKKMPADLETAPEPAYGTPTDDVCTICGVPLCYGDQAVTDPADGSIAHRACDEERELN